MHMRGLPTARTLASIPGTFHKARLGPLGSSSCSCRSWGIIYRACSDGELGVRVLGSRLGSRTTHDVHDPSKTSQPPARNLTTPFVRTNLGARRTTCTTSATPLGKVPVFSGKSFISSEGAGKDNHLRGEPPPSLALHGASLKAIGVTAFL